MSPDRRHSQTKALNIAGHPSFDLKTGDLIAVVDTPKGSSQKYAFSDALGAFELRRILPLGTTFPYSFGYVPPALGEDGDPLDVLLLLHDPTPIGCLVRVRLVGVIEARQRSGGRDWIRNVRLIGVANADKTRCRSGVNG